MASMFTTLARLANTPQGRAAIRKAKEAASRPENRAKINEVVTKIQSKGGRGRPR